MTSQHPSNSNLVSFAHHLANASGAVILPFFRSSLSVQNKAADNAGFDPVTEADRAGEREIRDLIFAQYPTHAILGEEHGSTAGDGPFCWVIDPIDGTRAFIAGIPTWGTLIGLETDGEPTIGLMDQPYTRDRFWSDGRSSFFRGPDGSIRTIKTRQVETLSDALLATTDPDLFTAGFETNVFRAIQTRARTYRYGTDCSAYAMLAAGSIDLVIEAGLKPYDIVALIPIVENAGGMITTWDGGEARGGGRIIAAANARLHNEALQLIRDQST